ncbi:thiosulfate oxidation carrier protein SoxY [Roseateles violae]|uniref:Thiosulfate oxidation carrier protein SoxY n=1 Tax=Roseateles violae TaxID=3058042 RepID=A0ABT8DPQ3_9BURK|nr:thiosulfate oxidation carrier protein SoxY [Pelomonas sp. PFR6]MDN3919020.1 thiosulfate oxidation carrier protein SoxY [Pelomonas sp. PFR6]
MMMTTTNRRDLMKHSAVVAGLLAGVLPMGARAEGLNRAAFDAKTIDELTKAMGIAKPVESPLVTLTGPDIAENGAVVPLAAASTAPGVKRLLLLVEKNPAVLTASFDVTDAVEPAMSTRVKMGQTSNVYAVAITADNKVLFAQKEVKVTLGGCGG